jgi:hypothetical protein
MTYNENTDLPYLWTCSSLPHQIRSLSREAFCTISRAIPLQKSKPEVMKLLNSLRGTVNIGEIPNVIITLPAEVLDHWKEIAAAWKEATHWVEWWTKLSHLCMLCDTFHDPSVGSKGHQWCRKNQSR